MVKPLNKVDEIDAQRCLLHSFLAALKKSGRTNGQTAQRPEGTGTIRFLAPMSEERGGGGEGGGGGE